MQLRCLEACLSLKGHQIRNVPPSASCRCLAGLRYVRLRFSALSIWVVSIWIGLTNRFRSIKRKRLPWRRNP